MQDSDQLTTDTTRAEPEIITSQGSSVASITKKGLMWKWVIVAAAFTLLLTGLIAFTLRRKPVSPSPTQVTINSQTVNTKTLAPATSTFQIGINKVVINGQVQANQGLILQPTDQPTTPTKGQIYLDANTNTLRYYDGTKFVTVADQNALTSLAANLSNIPTNLVNSLQGSTGALTLSGTNGVTISANGVNISIKLPQGISVTNSPTFAGLTLSTPLAITSGGTGVSSFPANSSITTDDTGVLQSASSGSAGMCLLSNTGAAPSFQACPGSAGVSSINGGTGAVTLANATNPIGIDGTITIDNAAADGATKGIATFNSTNFFGSTGIINTIQDINTAASPTFAGLTLTSPLTVGNGGTGASNAVTARFNLSAAASGANNDITSTTALNTITPSAALTVGATGKQFTLQGNSNSVITATNGANTTTLGFVTPTANVTFQLPTASAGTYSICTSANNCSVIGGGGTNGTIPVFSGAQTIANSIITQSGSVITINGSEVLQGSGSLTLGTGSTNTGSVAFKNSTNNNTVTLQSGVTSSGSLTFTLPTADGTSAQCLTTNGSGALSFSNCLSGSGGSGVISLDGLAGTLTVANSSGAGSTITINNAAADATTKGIATFNATNFNANSGIINTAQDINTAASPTFAGLTLTGDLTQGATNKIFSNTLQQTGAGHELDVTANNDQIKFTANGLTFFLPTNGGLGQTICTSGISCPSGGGTAVLLGPSAAQVNSNSNSSIFINDTGGGNLLQLQTSGVDKFLVDNSGNVSLSSGATLNLDNISTLSSGGDQLTFSANSRTFIFPTTGPASQTICTTGITCVGAGQAVLLAPGSAQTNSSATDSSIFINNTSTAKLLQLQSTGSDVFTIDHSGNTTITGGTLSLTALSSGVATVGGGGTLSSVSQLPINLGGTNATTAAGARSNLSAAVLGANNDITSTTALNTITPSAALTIGATGQQFTLQGNASSVITATNGVNTTTLGFVTPTAANSVLIPNESGTICLQNSVNCGFALSGGSGSFIQNQNSVDQVADFRISGTGRANTSILTPLVDTATSVPLNIGTTNTTAINLNQNTTIAANKSFTANGNALFKAATNSPTSLQIQNNSSSVLFNADTTNMRISVGSIGTATGQLYVSGTQPTDLTSGGVGTGTNPRSISIQGRYAYIVVEGSNKLQVFDISNPASPSDVSSGGVTTGAQPISVSVQGHFAYVVDFSSGVNKLQVFDISNPTNPTEVTTGGGATTASQPISVYVQGRYAYVASSGGLKLQIFDISNPAKPTDVSSGGVTTIASPQAIYAQGGYVYIVELSKLQVFDVSNPASPTDVSSGGVATGSQSSSIYVQGRYAYVADFGANKLQIFDISNPATPTDVSSGGVTTAVGPESVYVQGRYAYIVVEGSNKLQVFDISNPASPSEVTTGGGVATGTQPISLWVQGRYAYIADFGGNRLQVFDLGGTYDQQLQAGGAEVGTLAVSTNASIAGDGSIQGGLTVGSTLEVNGNFGVGGQALFKNQTDSIAALQIQNAAGTSNLFVADTTHSRIGIETSTPSADLTFGESANRTINVLTRTTNAVGNTLTIQAGNAGAGGSAFVGGDLVLQAGNAAGTGNAVGGNVVIKTGTAVGTGSQGNFDLQDGTNQPYFRVYYGATTSVSCGLFLTNICNYTSGLVNIPNSNVNVGLVTQPTNFTSVGSGSINIATGNAIGSTSNSGNINIGTGTATATPGSVIIKNGINATNSFQIQNAAGGQLFNADTSGSNITIDGLNTGEPQPWLTNANALPANRQLQTTVIANGYIYAIGGASLTSSGYTNTTYYAKLNANGSVGTWQSSPNLLPGNRGWPTSVVANGYIYVIGGFDGTSYFQTTFYAKLNSDGSIGAWKTSTKLLPQPVAYNVTGVANGYVYAIGGQTTSILSTVYYAKLNPNGDIGAWQTNANSLPAARGDTSGVIANGYVYVFGGGNAGQHAEVYYAKLNSDGSTGAWQTNVNSLPNARAYHTAVAANGYAYVIGGQGSPGSPYNNTIYYAHLNGDGSTGVWQTNAAADALPANLASPSSAIANGYMYVLGGINNSNTVRSTVYYSSTSRILIGGSLDLVGLGGQNNADVGGTGGTLTAGNATIVGTLDVRENANFTQSVGIGGNLTVNGGATIQGTQGSNNFLQVQNVGGVSALNISTVNQVGNNSFESGSIGTTPDGWIVKGASTVTTDNTIANFGSNSMKVATTTAASDGAKFNYPLLPSTQYSLSLYAAMSAGSISDFVVGHQEAGSDINCLTGQTINTTWTRFTCTFTTGSTISGTPNIYVQKSGGSAETFFIDGVQLELASSATAYRTSDINLNGLTTLSNAGGGTQLTIDTSGNAASFTGASGSTGGAISLTGGTGSGGFISGGAVSLQGGSSINGGTTNGGATITAGAASNLFGSGSASIVGGNGISGNSNGGNVVLQGGAKSGTGSNGNVIIQNANSSFLFSADQSTSNIILNGGFESTNSIVPSSWSAKTGSTLSLTSSFQQQGNNALQIATSTSAGSGATYSTGPSFLASTTQYTLSFWARLSSGSMATFEVGRADDGSTDTSCATGQTLNTTWTYFTCNFTTGTVSGTPYVYFKQTGAGTSRNIILDAVQLEAGASASVFNPGGQLQLLGTINSPLTIKPKTDSSQVFQVQNSAGSTTFLSVDTTGNGIVNIQTATSGTINIGTINNLSVVIGKTAGSGTLTVNGSSTFNGTITVNGHIVSGNLSGGTTGLSPGNITNCTDGAAVTVFLGSSNDTSGQVEVITGTTCSSAGVFATVTFANNFGPNPKVFLSPADTNSAKLQFFSSSVTAAHFSISSNTIPGPNTTYVFNYLVVQ